MKEKNKKNIYSEMEEQVLDFWTKSKTFEKSVSKKAPHGDYVFYDGPPFATGTPHYGNIVASVMKDAVPRYWTMKGYRVERKWGWDCHGLPVENLAEQELKLKDKTDIEKIGVEKFNDYCHSIVLRYVEEWKKIIKRIGRWADMESDYKTMDADYMESIWWVFKSLWDKGLIYKGYKAMHICPRCGTTLSNFEVTQGYKDIKDLSCIAKFELVDEPGTYILAWTTTPWTLPGNMALAVGDDIDYVKAKILSKAKIQKAGTGSYETSKDEYVYIAKSVLEKFDKDLRGYVFPNSQHTLKIEGEVIKGKKLVGKEYKPLFGFLKRNLDINDNPFLSSLKTLKGVQAINDITDESYQRVKDELNKKIYKIYSAKFVNTEEGTGIVHIAPAFGEDDLNLAKEEEFPAMMQHIDENGVISGDIVYHSIDKTEKCLSSLSVKPKDDHQRTDIEIIKYLAHNNLLFAKEEYKHSYPHCWRCDTPLLNYATDSWFVEVTKIKDDLIKNNKEVHWVPEHIKEGRFGKWLEEAKDWAISRNRYWGAPLPVWVCEKCEETKVIGSIEELNKLSNKKINDLHKQYVDKILLECKCRGKMKRIPEVLDCWFESGSMPYAQDHYPFENKEKFEKGFPADFIAEGVDQTRGWFYTLHVLATALKINNKNTTSFKNVIVNGIVLAENGQKMSKRLNNYPDPAELFEKYSVDAMRYYLLSSPVLMAENLNFSEEGVKLVLQKVEMLLWNVYKFYAMFAEDFKVFEKEPKSDNVLDKWILARLNQLIKATTKNMDEYHIPKAVRPIEEFISDLSTWYIRRSRDRFKGSSSAKASADKEGKKDKQAALETTSFVLLQLSKAMAPFMPFLAEQVWQKVTRSDFENEDKSVHLEKWPNAGKIDEKIIKEMGEVRKIVELGLAERDAAGIKVRQPLSNLRIMNYKLDKEYENLVKDELNVKNIESKKGSGDLHVELDTEITEELRQEGGMRELVRFINSMRKEDGLTIAATIEIGWESDDKEIREVIVKCENDIVKSTLAKKINEGLDGFETTKEVKVNGGGVLLGIKKL